MRRALVLILMLLILQAVEGMEYLRTVNASEILANISAGMPVEYDHVTIKGNLDLNRSGMPMKYIDRVTLYGEYTGNATYVKSPIRIKNSRIEGKVKFSFIIFQADVIDFTNTKFLENASFVVSRFNGSVSFDNSQFNGVANFEGSQFNSNADFKGSQFNRSAYFRGSQFNKSVVKSGSFSWYESGNFDGSQFNDTADFEGSQFNGVANLEGSQFNDTADFRGSQFNDAAGFGISQFNKEARFSESQFNDYARFWDSIFNGKATFERSHFNGEADFDGSQFNHSADFNDSIFNSSVGFMGSTFNSTAGFIKSTFSKGVSFNDVQFEGFTSFNISQFKDNAFFENTTFEDKLALVRTSYGKLYIRWYNIKKGLLYDDSAYLALIKNFKDLGYLEDSDNCYFQYRSDRRGQPWPCVYPLEEPARKSIDFLSEWSYGYGTRPVNPFIGSLMLIGIFGFAWSRLEFRKNKIKIDNIIFDMDTLSRITLPKKTNDNSNWPNLQSILAILEPYGFSAIVFLSGARFLIEPPEMPEMPEKSKHMAKHLFTIERVLGAIFVGLFLLAIGRTVIRAA